jgi:uncharacterized protein DUF4126
VDLFLAISTGIGLALATGVRPFLPPLLAGVLARADLGLDFDSTDFAFLESVPFLAAMLVLTAAVTARSFFPIRIPVALVAIAAVVLGALEFGGSLADESYAGGPGLAAGAVCALIGYAAATTFLGRAEARLTGRGDPGSSSLLAVYGDGAALLVAALAIVAPPLSYLALAFCAWTLVERRRRATRKYEGLRVLR